MKMKKFLTEVLMMVLIFSLAAGPAFAKPVYQDKRKVHIHHNNIGGGDNNVNNRIYFKPQTTNNNTALSKASSSSQLSSTIKNNFQATVEGGSAQIGDISNVNVSKGGSAEIGDISNFNVSQGGEGGSASVGNVTGIQGGVNFSIRDSKRFLDSFEMPAPNIQPTFDYGEVEDSTIFSGLMPFVTTREMAEAAVPPKHPIQGALKKLRVFTGVFNLKDAKQFDLRFIPKDKTFKVDRPEADKLTLLKTWSQEENFLINYKRALEEGYVFVFLGKIGGKPMADADLLFNASLVGAMNLGMTHYAPYRFMTKKAATSTGDKLQLTGNLAGGAGTAWNAAGGGDSESNHAFNTLVHGSHMLYFVQDEVRANEILSQMEGIPALSAQDEKLEGKYIYKIYGEYARLLFNEPKILPADQPVIANMGHFIVANWDFFQEQGLQPVIMVHRDERGPASKQANEKYNGGLGLASGEVIRAAIKAESHVNAFLTERGITGKEWNKFVVYTTSGADHPLISNAVSPQDHGANRTAHLIIVPGGIRPGLKSRK